MNIEQMLQEIRQKKRLSVDKIVVGKLSDEIVAFLKKKSIAIHTREVFLTAKGLSHLARESKKRRGAGLSDEDIKKLPDILQQPAAIFFEKKKGKFVLLYCGITENACIKVVVDTKGYATRKNEMTLVKTAGYIQQSDMNNPDFELIFGDWKF